jgi:hypothetical protein
MASAVATGVNRKMVHKKEGKEPARQRYWLGRIYSAKRVGVSRTGAGECPTLESEHERVKEKGGRESQRGVRCEGMSNRGPQMRLEYHLTTRQADAAVSSPHRYISQLLPYSVFIAWVGDHKYMHDRARHIRALAVHCTCSETSHTRELERQQQRTSGQRTTGNSAVMTANQNGGSSLIEEVLLFE